jgi:DNA-binding HxlR family transcriptional regulator
MPSKISELPDDTSPVDACPIAPTVSVIFGRWTTEVLWTLMHSGTLRFSDLRRHIPEVTPKVLAQRLRHLERDGLITRTYYREVPPRVEYAPTELAASLVPIFVDLERWSRDHLSEVEEARRSYSGPLPS